MLSKKEKWSYLCGDLGCCLMNYMLTNYFMFYCTNMLGIAVGVVGTIMFVARIWDALNDIAVGALVDRTHTKAGKARPWIKWFGLPCALSCFMMFAAPPSWSMGAKIALVTAGYMLFALFYTTVNLPYGSMLPLMTKDQVERASLSSFRMIGAYIGIVIVNATALPLVAFFGEKLGTRAYGYTATTAILCIGALIAFTILYRNCHEQASSDASESAVSEKAGKKSNVSVIQGLKMLVKNKPWLIVFTITVLNFLKQPFTSTSMTYYFLYYFKVDETKSALFSTLGMAGGLVVLPFVSILIKKLGYKRSLVLSYVVTAVFSVLAFVAGKNMTAVLICYVMTQVGQSLPAVAVLSMLADTLEYQDLKTGARLEGLGFTANSFSTKAGPAIGGLLCTFVYMIGGLDTSLVLGQDQSSSAIMALRFAMFIIPALICLVQVILALIYPLSQEKMVEINRQLEERNKNQVTA